MTPLIFEFNKSMRVLICIGLPLLLGMSAVILIGSYHFLNQTLRLSVELQVDALVMAILGLVFLWLFISGVRTWYAFFTVYVIDNSGIKISFLSSDTSLNWDQLCTVRYRRSLGQIDMRFQGYSRLVVLNNVDMNTRRKTLHAALQLIERVSSVPIRRTLA